MAKKIPSRDHFIKKPRKVAMMEVDGDPIGVLLMSITEVLAWQTQIKELDSQNVIACLLVHTLCQEDGTRIFNDGDYQFILDRWTAEQISTLSNKAVEMNGLMKKAPAEKVADAKN